jgi:hypothetical protein
MIDELGKFKIFHYLIKMRVKNMHNQQNIPVLLNILYSMHPDKILYYLKNFTIFIKRIINMAMYKINHWKIY